MQVFEAIETLLAVRSYQDKAISGESVERILEAGRLTASAMNRQEWDFVVVQDPKTLQHLGKNASHGSYIAQAPLAIAIVLPKDSRFGPIDGARATQDMMLAAWEEGIGSNWVSNVDVEPIRTRLNIPEDRTILNIIPFGYPAQPVGKGIKKRKPLSSIAHKEQFGQTYKG